MSPYYDILGMNDNIAGEEVLKNIKDILTMEDK